MNKREKKEHKIFESVMRLWRSGIDLHDITVQQIADAAGIGKGTVYEYFASREEIISKAMLYQVENALLMLDNTLKAASSFQETLIALLRCAEWIVQEKANGLQMVITCLHGEVVPHESCDAYRVTLGGRLNNIFSSVIEKGLHEGVVSAKLKNRCAMLALTGAVMAYVDCRYTNPDIPTEEVEQDVLVILNKALS